MMVATISAVDVSKSFFAALGVSGVVGGTTATIIVSPKHANTIISACNSELDVQITALVNGVA